MTDGINRHGVASSYNSVVRRARNRHTPSCGCTPVPCCY
ncbi:MAG: hypothetical protein ACKOKH_00585 [Bacteroidota bacterium]